MLERLGLHLARFMILKRSQELATSFTISSVGDAVVVVQPEDGEGWSVRGELKN